MISAIPDTSPGILYTNIMKRITRARPIPAAFKLLAIASSPNWAATTLERSSLSSSFRPPIRMVEARFSASAESFIPEIWALPSLISAFTFGTLTNLPS